MTTDNYINQLIQKVLEILKVDQELAKDSDDCERCRLTKTLKNEVILLSAEITKLQSNQYFELTSILEKTMETLEGKVEVHKETVDKKLN